MALELDERQRAMLLEMGVRVWLPDMAAVPSVVVLQNRAAKDDDAVQAAPVAVPVATVVAPVIAPVVVRSGQSAPQGESGTMPSVAGADAATLARSAASCQACGLCAGRKQTTLQAADLARQADWLVLGDPPDEDEDRLGQAFAAHSGVLLDNMLTAIGASRTGKGRAGAYLSNVVKCRPPNGQLPQATDLATCAQFLHREMELVRPKLIVAMGRFAAQLALQEHPQDAALPLGKQRGRVYHYRGIPVLVTYHPKVLLRASADKAKAWADLCLAMDILDGVAGSLQ